MKKILLLMIMVFGLNTKVFAGYNMIEAIKVHEIACLKNPKEITKKEMKLIKKYGLEYCYEINIENNKDLDKEKDGLESDKHLDEQEKTKNSK